MNHEVGREIFLAMPVWAIVAFYILAAVALLVFFFGLAQRIGKYRKGRADDRAKPSLRKLVKTLGQVFGNLPVIRNDPYAGIAHFLILWGFVVLFIGTLIILVDRDLLYPLKSEWQFWTGDFYLVFSLLMDVFGVALLVGLAMMAVRRAFFRRPQFNYARAYPGETDRANYVPGDWLFLGLILIIVLGGYFLESVRIVAERRDFEVWSPVGWWLADQLRRSGLGAQRAERVYGLAWWTHSLVSLGFIAYIPYSKAVHLVLGFFSLTFKDESAPQRLPKVASGDGTGYRKMSDLTWNELLSLDACVRCGRCHVACPAATSGMPLSPRDVILDLRGYAEQTFAWRFWRTAQAANEIRNPKSKIQNPLAGGLIPGEALWSCTTCLACVERCPVGVQHVPLMVQMRRALVDEGAVDSRLQQALMDLSRPGNSFGQSERMRARWTQGLPFEIKDARKGPVEYLWFVGDYASYDPRLQEITRTVARLFHAAGLDFGILYEAERNAGNDVRRVGEEGLFELLAEKNIKALSRCTLRRIVTTDPHTYNTLKNEYPDLGTCYPVSHYTEVLWRLIEEGRLPLKNKLNARVTYHDPCYLGRYNGIYDEPRRVLKALGAELVEMPRRRQNGYCCGAGGGRIWMEDRPGIVERPAESRIREAVALPGVQSLVVACPKDLVMFQDAIKTTGNEGKVVVKDLAELVWEAVAHG
jgi:Fe-S oxidoreductase/nitrate reductase gamma subunit